MTNSDHSTSVGNQLLVDTLIAPGSAWVGEVRRGQVLRLIDVEGQQVGDFVCFNLDRLDEKLSPPNTANLNRTVRLTKGHVLYSDEASRMFTITADTCKVHDILAGACSSYTNRLRYGVEESQNCRDNFASVLRPYGIAWKDVPYAFNIFMNVPIKADNSLVIEEPVSRSGDYVDLTAEMDCLVAISNCPQVLNPCNAYRLKPLCVQIRGEPGAA